MLIFRCLAGLRQHLMPLDLTNDRQRVNITLVRFGHIGAGLHDPVTLGYYSGT